MDLRIAVGGLPAVSQWLYQGLYPLSNHNQSLDCDMVEVYLFFF